VGLLNFDSGPLFAIPEYDPGPEFCSVPPVDSIPPSSPLVGSFEYDLQHNYKLRWGSIRSMHAWMKSECRDKSIEFVKKKFRPRNPNTPAWNETHVYVCARQGSGGKSKYRPTKGWTRKISSKRTGCPCRLTVKTYPDTTEVLGFYKSDHEHPIGDENLKYMRLDAETRQEIERMLRLGVEPKRIVRIPANSSTLGYSIPASFSSRMSPRTCTTRATWTTLERTRLIDVIL
jgi:hypothetical protein